MFTSKRVFKFTVVWIVPWLILNGTRCRAQDNPNPRAQPATLEDSVRALAGEIRDLNATIQELRAEVARSRQETSELRSELHSGLARISTGGTASASVKANFVPAPAPSNPTEIAPTSAPLGTTEARLDQLEESQQLLQAKVDEQHQSKVESASKYRMKLSGIALLNLFGNNGAVDNQDIPNLALARGAGQPGGSFGATLRQSEIGLEAYGPSLGGARVSGSVNFDFMGGFTNTSNGVADSIVRLRTAVLRLDWNNTSVVGGQDAPFFSPLSPTSFASLGYPAFAEAGNLWTWTPQVRVEHRFDLSGVNSLLLQGGILDPLSGEPPYYADYRTPSAGEQSLKPAIASRLAWSHGSAERALTLGVGGYYSRQDYGYGRTVDAWAGTADWNIPLARRFTFSGEFYRGRGLGGLGAAEGRSVLLSGPESYSSSEIIGLNTVGGWAQFKFMPRETVEFNLAYGQDIPFGRDLHYFYMPVSYGYTSIGRNQNAFVNVIYRPRGDLLFALEYRYLDTLQTSGAANQSGGLNLSMGVLF